MATTFGRILLRRDTAANWASTNPVLANGEPGWDSTNKVLKVGDGTSNWTTLPAITGGGGGGGVSLPSGGTTGQALVKNSNTSGDAGWANNVLTASSAAKLTTARTIAGKSFDGTGNITLATADLSDWASTATADGLVPAFESDTNEYIPTDLSDMYAPVDSSGRLTTGAQPKYMMNGVVVNEGDPAPADFPTGGIVFERPAPVSLAPTFAGSGFATGAAATTLVVNSTATFNVGDWIAVAVAVDASTATGTLPTLVSSVAPASGAWTSNAGPTTFQSGTVQVNLLYYKVTTIIPSGTAITLTLNQTRTHRIMAFAKMPNLVASSPLDVQAVNSGGSSATLSLSVGPTAARAQADELGLLLIGHNDSTTTTRPIVGTNNWTVLAAVESDNGTTSRTLTLLWQVFNATGTTTGTANVNAADGATGAWAGALATFKSV